ncbi:MAG TPA: valine--tRNA ligase [Dehalococcoidia bacterium]|nr:valine--tRNA ligase [Dehalococcoidia bacterium]
MTQQADPARPSEMAKSYDPRATEDRVYRFWETRGYFKPRPNDARPPFCIIMPPPNVTGELHVGHALTDTVEDILIRWHRMLGDPTLWVPGVDHAGIATQNVVEKQLAKEGLTRHDLGREEFERRVWQWVDRYRPIIANQHRRLGASADWSSEVFTLDETPQRAVRTLFKKLHDDGLIYRGERMINWCPRCRTALSDLEVEHEDQPGNLWHIRYPIVDGHDAEGRPHVGEDSMVVATTRPETFVGDVAVAVNPADERYRDRIGRTVLLPVIQREIPIVGDEATEMEFGTGALKVTPGHDPVDFEIAQRVGLPIINVMNLDATLNTEAGPYAGMDRYEARQVILRDLEELGYLVKVEPHDMTIGVCSRCHTVVEPLMSWQWFVNQRALAQPAIDAVRDGRITFVPERFERIYLNWMENIRDWCVSRQLWWGHRIPVWYSADDDGDRIAVTYRDPAAGSNAAPITGTYNELRAQGITHEQILAHATWSGVEATPIVAIETPERSPSGGGHLLQENDVLDTWFSSGLWPLSTLGWPDDTPALRTWYPTSVMETGYDIIFLWVARMIMLGLYNVGQIPYSVVYLHGTVRNEHGQRMSKSLGTGIDPLEIVEQYGADALRYTLITSSGPGNDLRLSEQRVEAGRNFANKLWNAARFVISMIGEGTVRLPEALPPAGSPLEDRWILSRVEGLVRSVDEQMGKFELGEAARQVYEFVWGEFADWYIEIAKVRVRADVPSGPSPLPVLAYVLERCLRLLHPVMPFVTEEIWQALAAKIEDTEPEALIVAPYPRGESGYADAGAEREMALIIDVVRAVRNIRAEKKVEPARFIEAYVAADGARGVIEAGRAYVETLARVRPLHVVASVADAPRNQVAKAVLEGATAVVPLAGLFDLDAERGRLSKLIAEAEAEAGRIAAKLDNAGFRAKAPAKIIATEEERLAAARTRLDGLRATLDELA